MGTSKADVDAEVARLLARAKRVILPIFLASGALFMGLAATGHGAAATAVFAVALVATVGWNLWFARWRRRLESGLAPSDPWHRNGSGSLGTRATRGLRAMTRGIPVQASTDAPLDAVAAAMATAADEATASYTAVTRPDGVTAVVCDLRVPDVRNDVHVALEGELRWAAPGRSTFTGRIGPRGQTLLWAAVLTLALAVAVVVVVGAATGLIGGGQPVLRGALVVWGAFWFVLGTRWAVQHGTAALALERVVDRVFGDGAPSGRPEASR